MSGRYQKQQFIKDAVDVGQIDTAVGIELICIAGHSE